MGQKRSRKKLKLSENDDREVDDMEKERQLSNSIFGGPSVATNDLFSSEVPQSDGEDDLFQIDRSGGPRSASVEDEVSESEHLSAAEKVDSKERSDRTSAWFDEDDAQVDLLGTNRLRKLRTSKGEENAASLTVMELERRLRTRHERSTQVSASTDWAALPKPAEDSSSFEDDRSTVSIEQNASSKPLLRRNGRLPSGVLSVVRCPDANQSDPNKAVVQAVNFHPGSNPDQPLLLTGGLDKTLRFFQVGADKSEKVHGIHFPKLPIYSASFLGTTGNVVVSGRRSFFYLYDAVAGKLDHVPRILGRDDRSLEKCYASPDGKTIAFTGNDGYIILFDIGSKQGKANLKMNGSVRSIAFTPDNTHLLSSGSDGDVYCWDLRTLKCVERFSNNDGGISSYLEASHTHWAVGSESGVVNLYSSESSDNATTSKSLVSSRSSLKSVMNLHTSTDMLRFNHDGQILAMSSRRQKNSFKLLHVPSKTVFSNWPTSKTPIGYAWSCDFSPESKFLALGNDKGRCLLYRLGHYGKTNP